MIRPSCLLVFFFVLSMMTISSLCSALELSSPTSHQTTTIRVCQNKHCCKRNPFLFQTISNLVGSTTITTTKIDVESSGCLSHCEKGPNMEIITTGNKNSKTSVLLNGVTDVTTAAVELECTSGIVAPKWILAASKVMEKAEACKDPIEQVRLLNSVITKLSENEDPMYSQSTALAHAYAMRSRAYWNQQAFSEAIQDAQQVVNNNNLAKVATAASLTMAFRTWVDSETSQWMNRRSGSSSPERILAVLQLWYQTQPQYRTKIQREMQEVVELFQNNNNEKTDVDLNKETTRIKVV